MKCQNATAYRHLSADPVLSQLIHRTGRPGPFDWAERDFPSSTNFEAMALHIVGQQISVAAALTISARNTTAERTNSACPVASPRPAGSPSLAGSVKSSV